MTSFLDSFLSMAWNKTAALTSTSKEERNSSDDEGLAGPDSSVSSVPYEAKIVHNVIVDWDTTNPQQFWGILLSLTLLITWLVFIAFYLSRVAGPVVAFVINRYLRWIGAQGRLSFGSFSLSVLGGKIMFRNAAYICDDFTLRCNDGWLIFSYWRCYGGKKLGVDDLSSESVRLHLSLNGLEFHVYNQLVYYERLARIYGLGRLLPPTDIDEKDVRTQPTPREQRQAEQWTASLLSLLAKVRCDISSGRFVAGNSLLPTSFVVSFENTALTMTTRPPSNALAGDRFMLVVHGVTENFRAGFVKTPDYRADNCTRTERYDEPPRTMGDGFAVLQTASLEFYYNQDILGQVNEKEGVQKLDSCVPIWESIWRLGKNTVISYGPWADKQRTLLYNLFYPPEYRLVAVTELPKAGEQRTLIRHEMRISTLHDAAIDIWFMREDEVNAIHAGIKQGSNFEVSIPWLTLEDGFTSTIKGSLLRVDASTSLSYRQLIECESFEFDVICRFPRGWNAHQRWDYNFRISKMTAWLVWDHKLFLQDLFIEWAGEDPPDMCTFIPWTWTFSFVVQDFEVILAMNDQNWIDTSSSQTAENCLAAIFGRKIEIGFDLPFGEFFPEKIAMRFELNGSDGLGLGLWLPPQHTMRPVLQCLDSAAVISHRKRASLPTNSRPMWRSATEANGWSDIWSTQSATLVFKYTFHQIPNLPRSDIPPDSVTKWSPPPITSLDQLAADHLSVEVDIGPSQVRLSGLIVKLIFIFKENYFGLFENLTDITSLDEQSVKMAYGPVEPGDLAKCRPFHVTVSLMLHNVEGHCLMHTPHRDSPMGAQVGDPCPVVFLEQLALEIDKRHSETILQVGLSPAVVHFSDRDHPDGHLSLSALQFRGHGMFSSIDVPLSAPTVEYGWLMDIVLGDLDGRLHPGQLITLVEFLDTFLFMILSKEEQLATPKVFDLCQHMSPVSLCDREPQAACLSEHHLKYEFIRFAMDSLHLIVMEDMAALELNAKSARLATCNAHASVVSQNVSVMLPLLQVRQFVACDMTKFTGWLECGSVRLADTKIDFSIPVKSTPDRLERRKAFLRKHDLRTKRLRFLWNDQDGRCGCTGGCRFFADDDVFGRQFFVRKSDKLAVVKIVESSTEQLGFGQSIFRKDQRLVSSTLPTDTKEMRSSVSVEMSVDDKYFETSQLDATEEDAASLTPSDVSFHSAHEDTNVNLYSHINCPVLTSDILMGNYAKYLNHFSARPLNGALKTPSFGGASIAKWLCENHFEFVKTRAGINAINLSEDTADHKRSVGGEQRMKKLEGRHDTVEVIGSISDGVELFLSPLSVECLQRLISSSAFALNAIHPAYIVQRLHADCSLRCHRQPLVVPPSATPASESNRFPPLQVFFVLPTVRCAVFQCGLVEKTIPYSRIEQADQLVQANVLVTISEQFRAMAATVSKKTDGSILMMPAKAETRRTHAQFLQIVSSQSTNIGIGKNVADSNFVTNWKDLSPICHHFELRQVVDAEVPEVSATLTLKNRIVAANSNLSQPPESPPTAARESNREPPEGATIFTPREEQDEVVVKIGPLSVIFGLCQPVDSSSDNRWPLFDMLAPTISAWIHVVHRLTQSTGKVADSLSEWRQLTLAKLLTDALQCDDDRVFMPPKSSFAPAKGFGKYLRGCPSCQVLLTLLRYCSAIGVEDDYETTTMHCGELLHDARLRRKALVVLLSHWQTVVCANKDVTLLDPSLAEKFKGSRFEYGDEDTEKSTPPPDVRITIEPESTSGDVSKAEAKKAAKSEKADKVDGDRLADRRISSASKRSIESLTRPKNIRRANAGGSLSSSPRSTLNRDAQPLSARDANEPVDLYHWMMRAHKEHKERRERNKTQPTGGHDLNPMEVVLSVYFWPMFDQLDLEPGGILAHLAVLADSSVAFSIEVASCEIDIVEPKLIDALLQVGTKRVSHTYHHLLKIEGVVASGHLEYRQELHHGHLRPKKATMQLQYTFKVDNIQFGLVFSSVAFISQLSLVVKSCRETLSDLEEATKKEMEYEKEAVLTLRRAASTESDFWASRVRDKLEDYQRSEWRLHTSTSKGVLVFRCFGVADIKQTLIEATLTELFVSMTLQRLQLGVTLTSVDQPIPKQEMSLSTELRRVMLILSEHRAKRLNNRTIFHCTAKESRLFLSSVMAEERCKTALIAEVGPIECEIPMHAAFIHEVVIRHGPQLNEQLGRLSAVPPLPTVVVEDLPYKRAETAIGEYSRPMVQERSIAVVEFDVSLTSIELNAQLLPSLRAKYQLERAKSQGTSGANAKFSANIKSHSVTLTVATTEASEGEIKEDASNKPNVTVNLPKVSASGNYVSAELAATQKLPSEQQPRGEDLIYREGGYLNVQAFIGKFEHTLTTILLNQILFVEEALRRELGGLVSRISAEKSPLFQPATLEETPYPLLFALTVRGESGEGSPWVQVTATTPSNLAVRLAIDDLEGMLTNRWVQKREQERERFFGRVKIRLNMRLGQFCKPAMYEELDPDFYELASFSTQIAMQNEESAVNKSYSYVIGVNRPILLLHRSAVDKAVLIWINYNGTYNSWNEKNQQTLKQRSQQPPTPASVTSPPPAADTTSSQVDLNLSLSVSNGLYICMPLQNQQMDANLSALVVSLDDTEINVCVKQEMACQGSFRGFKVRFIEDFDSSESLLHTSTSTTESSNYCFFPAGTYTCCSRTSGGETVGGNAAWVLSVNWQMQGMIVDLDQRIGKLASTLIATLTTFATDNDDPMTIAGSGRTSTVADSDLLEHNYGDDDDGDDTDIDEHGELRKLGSGEARTQWLERKMHEVSLLVMTLVQTKANENDIETARRQLRKLEMARFKQFRRSMMDKFRQHGQRATEFRDQLGLGPVAPSLARHRKSTSAGTRRRGSIDRTDPTARRHSEHIHPRTKSLGPSALATIISRDGSRCSSISSYASSAVHSSDEELHRFDKSESTPTKPRTIATESSTSSSTKSASVEPSKTINMHLDVQIAIESGKCVMRTKDEGNNGGGTAAAGGSAMSKRFSSRDLKGKAKQGVGIQQSAITETTLYIPSVDVKAYYSSLDPPDARTLQQMNIGPEIFGRVSQTASPQNKRGCVYVAVELASMPEETVLTPHLADFLEQVLEPLPPSQRLFMSTTHMESTTGSTMGLDVTVLEPIVIQDPAASFSIDMLFHVIVQSSSIRFDAKQPRVSATDCVLKLPRLTVLASTRKLDKAKPGDSTLEDNAGGGFHLSANLSDFSLSIFSPHQETHKRDALSLQLDELSLVLSRSRNQLLEQDCGMQNFVKFLLTAVVGSAKFNCDMRRMSELIAFPKPWYRRAIARRLFFGDEQVEIIATERKISLEGDSRRSTPNLAAGEQGLYRVDSNKSITSAGVKAWTSLVLFAVHWQELNVEAQMSNTMGSTSWVTKQGVLRGNAELDSTGYNRDIAVMFKLLSSELSARGGLISGGLSLSQFVVSVRHKKVERQPPSNTLNVDLGHFEARVEWMSRATFIGRFVEPHASFHDEWLTVKTPDNEVSRAAVYANVRMRWRTLEMAITRTTTADFVKIYDKLTDFFEKQLQESRMAWSDSTERMNDTNDQDGTTGATSVRHHRHWQTALARVTDLQTNPDSFFPLPITRDGVTVVGGSLEIEADEIALACMNGEMNAGAWALFHMREPSIVFTPEAQFVIITDVDSDDSVGTLVDQRFIVRLGKPSLRRDTTDVKAVVCRVRQSRQMPISSSRTIDQWLDCLIGSALRSVYVKEEDAAWAMNKIPEKERAMRNYGHSVLELFQFPPLEAVLTSMQQQDPDEPTEHSRPSPVVCAFIAEFHNALGIKTDFSAQVTFLPELLKSYLKNQDGPSSEASAQRRGGRTEHPTEELQKDTREFRCETWICEPRIRFIDYMKWNPPAIDDILKKLQIFDHRLTIPKWTQRGFLDPCDLLMATIVERVLALASKEKKA